ncbi:MAG TPA: hypothetical protein VM925_17660 [Labilithrix sp.]|nr:hypothetical protein [Labilithrix sp.]
MRAPFESTESWVWGVPWGGARGRAQTAAVAHSTPTDSGEVIEAAPSTKRSSDLVREDVGTRARV